MKKKNLKKVQKYIKKKKFRKARKLLKELLEEKKDAELLLFLEEREKNILQLDDEDMYLSQMEVMSMALELGIDKDMFLKWREARYGSTAIEKSNNVVWEWLIRTRASGYISRLIWGLGNKFSLSPGWSFSRFGMSKTVLPDGRVIYIGGEHEDHYDPDFFIYNDVIVIHPDDHIDIYTYSKDVFPPTDFHSATLVGEWIVMIGRLGHDSSLQETPIYKLNINDFSIQHVQPTGISPNRLHQHVAVLSQDRTYIRLLGGSVYSSDETRIKNLDHWELSLQDWSWALRKKSPWFRWTFQREDGCRINLSQARWKLEKQMAKTRSVPEQKNKMHTLSQLYEPPCSFEAKESEEMDVYRICIDGVVIRYDEGSHHITMTVEGSLPSEVTEVLVQDLVQKLYLIEEEYFQVEQV